MKYEIIGQTVPAVEITLDQGETVYTQSGGMTWQTTGIDMNTKARGGLGKSIGRMFAGESLFMVNYTAQQPGAKIAFAATMPGVILPIEVGNGREIIAQKGAFLCAEHSVELSVTLTKKFSAGFFGGEGFILEKIHGDGTVFLEVDGDIVEKELAPGEVIKVDSGNVVAFDSSVNYEVETVKGLGNVFFGGEGLFLTKLTGPGKVILQTLNIGSFLGLISK